MAYFPNGTSGAIFQAKNCDYCAQYRDREDYPGEGVGCPVFDAHILTSNPKYEDAKLILGLLISDTDTGPRCNLYTPISETTEAERSGQLRLPTEPAQSGRSEE